MQIKVEDFFRYFFSDDAVNFLKSFHERCGDKGRLNETNVTHFSQFAFWNFLVAVLVIYFILIKVRDKHN